MKGIICYYSGSGNTKLAVKYIKSKIRNIEFELHDIVKNDAPDLEKYDIVGFATFTDFGGVPQYFHSFFDKLDAQSGKYAFVFNTYGFISGKTLRQFVNLARAKKLNVLSAFSLHTPESYPPMRKRNRAFDNAPNEKELSEFDDIIAELDNTFASIQSGNIPQKQKLKFGILGTILPAFPRSKAKKDFGIQAVNENLCTQCKTCEKNCPYGAIHLDPFPIFNHEKCFGCWACYNHCKDKAIYTEKFKGEYQYPRPSAALTNKLQRI